MVNDGVLGALRGLLRDPAQQATLRRVTAATNFRVSDELLDAEIEYTASLATAARVSSDDLVSALANEAGCVESFAKAYIKAQDHLDLGQEYPSVEDAADDEDANEQYGGHSQTTLLQYTILYLKLKHQPSDLLRYLKAIREPHATRQAKLLAKFFAEFSADHPECR
jgi:hypothetical protein